MSNIEVDFEWAVKLNRIALDAIGLWPKTAQKIFRQKLMCNLQVFIIFLWITLGLLIPSIHSLIRIRGNIILMMDNLQVTLPTISSSIRIVIFWWKKEAIIWVMNIIAEDWIKTKNAQEKSVMIKRAQSARIIITCGFCLMGIGYIFVIVLPIFGILMRLTPNITDPGRPLPIQTYYIYDVTKTPLYELTFIGQIISVALCMICYGGIDNFLGLLVFHICGQLDILNKRLTHLDKYVNSRDMLKRCITKHIRLLRIISIIEDTYNMMLLALFVYFALFCAFYGFRIISLLEEGNDMSVTRLIYFICIVLNGITHMCLYCALGEILIAQSDDMYYAGYNNNWYFMDPKISKDLLFLLIRSTKPVYLTAGKVFPLTMATFCSLMKTSAGYISVLHTTRT